MKQHLFFIIMFLPTLCVWGYNIDTLRSETKFILNKSDCPNHQMGKESFEYTITSKEFKDTVGLKLPNSKASVDVFKAKAQQAINTKGTCLQLYVNDIKSISVVKNNCSVDSFGNAYTYIVPTKKYANLFSLDSVNILANKDIKDSAQIKANKYGTCSAYFYNIDTSKTVQKNDCETTAIGRKYVYAVKAKKYKDMTSLLSANNQAVKDLNDSAQIKANLYGVCVPKIKYVIKEVKVVKNVCNSTDDRIYYDGKTNQFYPRNQGKCQTPPVNISTTTFSNRP